MKRQPSDLAEVVAVIDQEKVVEVGTLKQFVDAGGAEWKTYVLVSNGEYRKRSLWMNDPGSPTYRKALKAQRWQLSADKRRLEAAR